jgi:hypothetical protein
MSFPFVSPKMEKEVSDFIQDSGQVKKKFQPMNKIERSILWVSLGWGGKKWAIEGVNEPVGTSGDQTPHGSLTLLPSLYRHDVVEVAGLTSFSFGEDDDCRYVMIFKKVKSLPPPPPAPAPAYPCTWEEWHPSYIWILTLPFSSSPGVCTLRWRARLLPSWRGVGPPEGWGEAEAKGELFLAGPGARNHHLEEAIWVRALSTGTLPLCP